MLPLTVETPNAAAIGHDPYRIVCRASRGEGLLEHERLRVRLGRNGRDRRRRFWRDGGRGSRDHANDGAGTDRDDKHDRGGGEGGARAKSSDWDHMASSLFMRSSMGGWVSKRWSKNAGASFSGLAMYKAAVALFATSSGSLSAAILRSADARPGG